jgi:3-(3-hydroxy-phenyl)propionate hydroxylase
MQEPKQCDVLIVGGGPTGVTLGLLLARGGVDALIIDKEADIYSAPRAAHIDHEIVRIFQELGVADEIMASTRCASRYDFLTSSGDVLLRFEGHDRIGPGGWPVANMIHQPSLERTLRSAAAQQSNLRLKTNCMWLTCEQQGNGVVSEIQTAQGPVKVCSRFVIGCDGARSPVRSAAEIEFDDLRFDEPWLVVDVIVHDAARLPTANLQICDPNRPTTCVLMGSGRHRWEFMLKPEETPEQVTDDAFIAELLKPWNVDGAVTIERKAVYQFNAKVAKTWRKGPVMLAGDAAHLMPPFAGQGMCSGVRDAANLAWKLVAIKNGASEALLDTYQPEREPLVRGTIGLAMMMGRMVCLTDPDAARARDAEMLAARAAGGAASPSLANAPLPAGCILTNAAASGRYFPQALAQDDVRQKLDDILGTGASLITRPEVSLNGSPGSLKVFNADNARLAPFRSQIIAWLDHHQSEAVLIRPDRYVFGAGDATVIQQAWSQWTS